MKTDKRKIAIYIMMWAFFLMAYVVDNITLYLSFSIILLAYIIFQARFSFFSELAFILVFTLFQTWIQELTGQASGMIQNANFNVPLYATEHSICTVTFLLTLLFFVLFTNLIANEKKIYMTKITLKLHIAIIFLCISVLLIVMTFPSVPTFRIDSLTRRTQGISTTYGWVMVALLLAATTYDMSNEHKWFWIFYGFIIFWTIGHAERVEILGFVSYMLLKSFNRNSGINREHPKLSLGQKIKKFGILVVVFAFLLFLIWIGLYRIKQGNDSYSLGNILRKLFVQGTAGDVIYVFDCAVDMWKHGNLTHGITYFNYLYELIPGVSGLYDAASYIKNFYFTVGGGLFFTEPMMNFGMIGVLVTNVTFCLFYSWVVRKANMFRAMFWIPFIIEIFRTAWYGRNGWELAAFIEVPMLYFAIKYVLNKTVITGCNRTIS